MKTAISLLETGFVPDALTRAGIRRLCAVELTLPALPGLAALSTVWFVALPLSFTVAKFAEGRKA